MTGITRFPRGQGLQEHELRDVGSGVCPLGPSRKVKAAVRKAIKEIGHFPCKDLLSLRRLFLSRYGIAGENLLFGNSLDEVLYLIGEVYRPNRVLISGPAPDIYKNAAAAAGAEILQHTSGIESGFAPVPETLMPYLEGCDMLFIANPNRITGRVTAQQDLEKIIQSAAASGVRVVLDEALVEFTGEDGYRERITDADNVIVLRTDAFFYGLPGLELSWAASSPGVIETLSSRSRWIVSPLAEVAARTALKDRTYRKLAREFVSAEKNLFRRELRKLPGITLFDSDSSVMTARLDDGVRDILGPLARAGFFVRTWRGGEDTGTFLCISVMEHDQNLKFIRILRDILSPVTVLRQ